MPNKSRTMKIFSIHYGPFISHNILWMFLILLGKCVLLTSAGNLNELPQWTVTIPDRSGIEFGFSLAHLFNQSQHTLLVGAPRDNTSQIDVVNPGALYSCSFTTDKSSADCQQLQVDWRNKEDNYKDFTWIDDDIKDHQRLGASLATSDKGVVVCAPGWHIFINYNIGKEDLPYGLCFEAREETNFVFEKKKEFSLAYSSSGKFSYKNRGACQAGFSVAYSQSQKQDSIAIGSPGCLLWQGDTWQKDGGVLNEDDKTLPSRRIEKMPLEDLDLTEKNKDGGFDTVSETYLGYSVAVGEFAGAFGIVTSMPRTASTFELNIDKEQSSEVVGPLVHIYHYDTNNDTKLKHWVRLTPPENTTNVRKPEPEPNALFSYFGYALAVADLNNDGLDDVVVGAPFYRNGTDHRSGHDGGAIFVYMQKRIDSNNAETPYIYSMVRDKTEWLPDGLKLGENSQFGAAVTAIGDINRDGYYDIAVGAPYYKGEDGHKGAVFIFTGGSNGLSEEPFQVLYASSVLTDTTGPIIGFGHAIASNFSATERHITDLAVGAFQNDTVFIYRSKELIRINVMKFEFSDYMDLTNKNCSHKSSEMHACVTLDVCLKYDVELDMGWHDKKREFQIEIEADSRKQRLMFDSGKKNYTIDVTLNEKKEYCETITVLAKNDIVDSISSFPITHKVTFKRSDGDYATWTHDVVLEGTKDLNILVDCKDPKPEACEADINLLANTKSNFTLSSSTNLKVEFVIENKGEQAFDTKLYIDSNGDLMASGQASATWTNNEWDDSIVNCEERRQRKSIIVCKLAAIFPTNKTLRVILSMSPSESFVNSYGNHTPYFDVNANVTSTSKFTRPEQAETSCKIPIIVDDQLDLTSKPITQRVEYNSSFNKIPANAQSFDELGPQIVHEYTLFNPEQYDIYLTQCTITWPLKIKGKYWNYLTKAPTFTGVQSSDCVIEGGEIDEFNIAEKSKKTMSRQNDNNNNNAIEPNITTKPGPSSGALIHSTRGKTKSSDTWNEDISWLTLTCDLGLLSRKRSSIITLRSHLVQETLTSLQLGISIQEMWSNAVCQAKKLPLNATPSGKLSKKQTETTIAYNYETPESQFPIWIIVVSIIGGLLLLAVIGLICWKIGFFKRKRPDQADGMDTDKDGYQEVPKDDVEATEDIEKTEDGQEEEEEEEEEEQLDKKSAPTTST